MARHPESRQGFADEHQAVGQNHFLKQGELQPSLASL
jgi:hypothetical protein